MKVVIHCYLYSRKLCIKCYSELRVPIKIGDQSYCNSSNELF